MKRLKHCLIVFSVELSILKLQNCRALIPLSCICEDLLDAEEMPGFTNLIMDTILLGRHWILPNLSPSEPNEPSESSENQSVHTR